MVKYYRRLIRKMAISFNCPIMTKETGENENKKKSFIKECRTFFKHRKFLKAAVTFYVGGLLILQHLIEETRKLVSPEDRGTPKMYVCNPPPSPQCTN